MGNDGDYSLSSLEERMRLDTIEDEISEELASPSAVDTARAITKKISLECSLATIVSVSVGIVVYYIGTYGFGDALNFTHIVGALFTIFYTKGTFCKFGSASRAEGTNSDPGE